MSVDIEDKPVKGKSLFDLLTAVQVELPTYFSRLDDNDKRSWSSYMINRFLSMNPHYIELVDYFQRYSSILEPNEYFKLLASSLPRKKTYNKYIKADKEDKYEEWLITIVSEYYRCSKKEAIDNIDLLFLSENGINEIQNICEMNGINQKDIKKLIKTKK